MPAGSSVRVEREKAAVWLQYSCETRRDALSAQRERGTIFDLQGLREAEKHRQ